MLKDQYFFHKLCLSLWSSSLAPLDSEPREFITERFITKCSVVYARVSPRGSRTIDRMTNVLGSHRLHRGLVNQEIFSISMSREALFFLFFPSFLFCTNIMPLPWQGARKPHAKNDVTTLWKRSAKRGPHVNSALAELYFFPPHCVCHAYRRNTLPGLIELRQVEIARLWTRWMKAASDKDDLCRDKAPLTKSRFLKCKIRVSILLHKL